MKCDRCDAEATVHEVTITSGKRRELHLCEQCAHATGVAAVASKPITELISQFLTLGSDEAKGKAIAATAGMCQACGTTFDDFRHAEKLGCMHCYQAFERQIGGLLERLHHGATHHVGKTPRRLLAASTRAEQSAPSTGDATVTPALPRPRVVVLTQAQLLKRLASLKANLDAAITAEQYEKAARLRDELLKLQRLIGGSPDADPSAPPEACP